MRLRLNLYILLLCGLWLCGCWSTVPPAPVVQEEPLAISPADDLHLLFAETAQVNRASWNGFYVVTWGSRVRRGDLVKAGAEDAKVVCDTLTVAKVLAGQTKGVKELCPPAPTVQLRSGAFDLSSPRGGDEVDYPYIITPRHSAVYTTTPLLSWQPLTNTLHYTVSIQTIPDERVVWTTTTTATQVIPSALLRGGDYIVTVVTDSGRSSSEESLRGLGFNLLGRAEAEQIESLREKVMGAGLNSAEANYTLAALYQTEGLYSEAITLLTTEIGSARALIRMGDLYRLTWLEAEAVIAYESALTLSIQSDDVEGIALANTRIAGHHASFWRGEQAYTAAQTALERYRVLGDETAVQDHLILMGKAATTHANKLKTQNETAAAIEWYRRAQDAYRQAGALEEVEKIEQLIPTPTP